MGSIVKELKEKITAAGGDTTGVQTVSEALDKLPAGDGSSGLILHATILHNLDDSDILVLDKTALEIATAFEEHGNVWFLYENVDPVAYNQLYVLYEGPLSRSLDDGGQFIFYCGSDILRFGFNGPSDYPASLFIND